MALDAVTKYIKDRKGTDRVVLHPVIGTPYVMIVMQASVEPNLGQRSPNSLGLQYARRTNALGRAKREEYFTALSRI